MSKNRAPARPRVSGPDPLFHSAAGQSDLRMLVDVSPDGLALTDGAGTVLAASRRLAEMFGYDTAELVGNPVELLIPAGLPAGHRGHLASYACRPIPRPMEDGLRLLGMRKDRTTFPAEISLSPLPAEEGQIIVAVIRDVTQLTLLEDQAAAAAAETARTRADYQLHDTVVSRLFIAGLLLQTAADLPAEEVRQRIGEAAEHLDDTIREIRDTVFAMTIPPATTTCQAV
jgi:PAS domain S-box-containing protein